MKTNNLQDLSVLLKDKRPRISAVKMAQRHSVPASSGATAQDTVEFRISAKKKELAAMSADEPTPRKVTIIHEYFIMFMGEWRPISSSEYLECKRLNMNVKEATYVSK